MSGRKYHRRKMRRSTLVNGVRLGFTRAEADPRVVSALVTSMAVEDHTQMRTDLLVDHIARINVGVVALRAFTRRNSHEV